MEKQRKIICGCLTELFQTVELNDEDGHAGAVFYYKCQTEASLLPRSICCKLPAAAGVAIDRKYEQIINAVTSRTVGQNDFIFTTGHR